MVVRLTCHFDWFCLHTWFVPDIEQQLEMAESRCNNLKDQLDTMKTIYSGGKVRVRKVSALKGLPTDSTGEWNAMFGGNFVIGDV